MASLKANIVFNMTDIPDTRSASSKGISKGRESYNKIVFTGRIAENVSKISTISALNQVHTVHRS